MCNLVILTKKQLEEDSNPPSTIEEPVIAQQVYKKPKGPKYCPLFFMEDSVTKAVNCIKIKNAWENDGECES